MNNLKFSKKNFFVSLLAALLIVIEHNLKLDLYIKNVILPFTTLLISYLYLLKSEENLNKKALIYLVPIMLILLSGVIFDIDFSNKILNVLFLPILLAIFFILLTNRNYKLSKELFFGIFDIFPKKLFSNLKFAKSDKVKIDKDKTSKTILGIALGGSIGSIILGLLMSADAYFREFIVNLTTLVHIDFQNIIIFIVASIVLFSTFINILINRNKEVEMIPLKEFDQTVVSTILYIINGIFVLFLISEVSRLTGNFLQLPEKYTYAGYAREGFFQLLFVTIINFGIIFYLLYQTDIIKKSSKIKKLLLILVIFSIMLVFNSYYRMFLYISNYGLTILRTQVILFLAMELMIFVILIKKLLKDIKCNDAKLYFIIMVIFYIINLYVCNNTFLGLFGY